MLAVAWLGVVPAFAADAPAGAPGVAQAAGAAAREVEHALLFAGTDLRRTDSFLYGGFVLAEDGLDRDGLTLKLVAGSGTYGYFAGSTEISAVQASVSLMPGWTVVRDGFQARVFAGLDLQHQRLDPEDPGNRLRGTHAGARVAAELWWEPMPDMMAKAAATWTSVGTSYALDGAVGWRVLETFYGGFYAGPEAQAFGDGGYRQIRIGVHLTAFRVIATDCTLGLGWARDNDGHAGPYVRFGMVTRR